MIGQSSNRTRNFLFKHKGKTQAFSIKFPKIPNTFALMYLNILQAGVFCCGLKHVAVGFFSEFRVNIVI